MLVLSRPTRVHLLLGADDGCVLWVGGKRVHENLGFHHHQFERDRIEVDLPAGETTVVVGVHDIAGAWGFSLRLAGADDVAPEGLSVKP